MTLRALLARRAVPSAAVLAAPLIGGCAGGGPLLHPAHTLGRGEVQATAGLSGTAVVGNLGAGLDAALNDAAKNPGASVDPTFAKGALVSAVAAPGAAPGGRAGRHRNRRRPVGRCRPPQGGLLVAPILRAVHSAARDPLRFLEFVIARAALSEVSLKIGASETPLQEGLRQASLIEAARDVGEAMARNPAPLIIPCHRVLAAGGKVGGFSAPGGSGTKLRMLELKGVRL